MDKQLIKTFSEIKSSCKTRNQRLAFNELVKSFSNEQDFIDFKKYAKSLANFDGEVFDTPEFEKFERLNSNIQPEFKEAIEEIIGWNVYAPKPMFDRDFESMWNNAKQISMNTGTEISFFVDYARKLSELLNKLK